MRAFIFALAVVLAVVLVGAPARAEDRPIPGQAADVPLRTAVTPELEARVLRAFKFGSFDKKRVLELRKELEPLAAKGDPRAQHLLGKTYDLFEFGQGDPADAKRALDLYLRAAEQRYAAVELFLYNVFTYSLMQVPADPGRALQFLERAYKHGSGPTKAEAATELARLTAVEPSGSKPRSPGVVPDAARSLRYLEEAHALDPKNQMVVDWLFSIKAERGDGPEALALAEKSTNPHVWARAADLCGKDRARAVGLLVRAARQLDKDGEKGMANGALVKLYGMVCRHEIAPKDLGDLYGEEGYKTFMGWQENCEIPRGG